jgi:hypothetical protein
MRIIPTATIGDYSTAIRKATAREIERKAEQYGAMVENDLQARVALIPSVGAAAKPHGTPGSVHNVSFSHRIIGQRDTFPIYVTVDPHGSKGDIFKMWLLNDGRAGGKEIRPRRKKWLKFDWQGETTYAKKVTQGSMAGLHFIDDAIAQLPGAVQRRFRRRR